jgi:hypothetical protein
MRSDQRNGEPGRILLTTRTMSFASPLPFRQIGQRGIYEPIAFGRADMVPDQCCIVSQALADLSVARVRNLLVIRLL